MYHLLARPPEILALTNRNSKNTYLLLNIEREEIYDNTCNEELIDINVLVKSLN